MADRRHRIEGSFNQGWPFAAFITALAIAAFVLAGVINRRTFHAPTDSLGPQGTEQAGTGTPQTGQH